MGTGGCETCAPEAEVHKQSHRVLQRVVRQAIRVFQNIDQPEDEAVSNHGCLQRAPRMKEPTGKLKLGRNFSLRAHSTVKACQKRQRA